MAKVTIVKAGFGNKNLGTFHAVKFNMFDAEDLAKYAELRDRANDASSGIKFEMIREYSRKTTVREGQGEDLVATTTEDIILVVQYWEKKPKRNKGDNDAELSEAKKDWSDERKVG
jgi:hypothetical protein